MSLLRTKDGRALTFESISIDEETKNTGKTYTAVRGSVRYAGTMVKHTPEDTVCTLREIDSVSEPCHCDLTTKKGDTRTATS